MEQVEILLFFCTGIMLVNIVLMAVIWVADKKNLYLYGIGLWLVNLVSFGLQGVYDHDPIFSILSFGLYYGCSLILVRVLQLTTSTSAPYVFYHGVMGLGVVVMLVLSWFDASFVAMALPVAIGVTVPMLHLSIRYLKGPNVNSMGKIYAGILILNSVHMLDYPFLRPNPDAAVLGFSLAFVFLLFLSIYFPIYTTKNIAQRYSTLLESEIEDHLKTEKKLKDAVASANNAARAKSEFLANMNHEIRTPLNGIMGMNQLMLQADFDKEDMHDYAKIIGESSDALLTLVNDLFDVNRLEAGRVELNNGKFSPKQCVNDVLERYDEKASRKRLSLTSALGDDVPEYVIGDVDRVSQVLGGLVDNAIKYTPNGGVNISVFYIKRSQTCSELVFEVLDTGIGISKEDQDRMFGIFTQADGSLTRERGGAGVGLYIGKRVVELMGGHLSCHSELGQGAVFKFSFPFEEV